jgi:uncharacterized protein (DUF885 family)
MPRSLAASATTPEMRPRVYRFAQDFVDGHFCIFLSKLNTAESAACAVDTSGENSNWLTFLHYKDAHQNGTRVFRMALMTALPNPKHENFAQALARGSSAAAAHVEAGYRENRHNAATLARKQHILTRVGELQEEQLSIHQQATADAAANAQVTIESLIAEAEAARAKAMEEKGGAAAAVSALIAKAKLAGMWREKLTGTTLAPSARSGV